MLAYGDLDLLKGTGINLVSRTKALEIESRLEGHLEAGRIRPIVGWLVGYVNLPEELERMERREMMGRTVLDWSEAR